MGNTCKKIQQEPIKKKIPSKDIEIQSFVESNGEIFDVIEKFIVFKHFRVEEIILLLSLNFSEPEVAETNFNIFVEKKMLKNVAISEWTLNDQKSYTRMKDYNDKFFDILFKAFKTFYKSTKNTKWEKKGKLPIENLIPLAILYGAGRNDVKFDLIFNYLSNSTGVLELNDKVRFFLFSLFVIPSAVELFVYKQLSEEVEDYKQEISKFDFTSIFEGYEVKDSINSSAVMIKELFGESTSLTYDELRRKIDSNRHLHSLLTPDGIRYFISHNGV